MNKPAMPYRALAWVIAVAVAFGLVWLNLSSESHTPTLRSDTQQDEPIAVTSDTTESVSLNTHLADAFSYLCSYESAIANSGIGSAEDSDDFAAATRDYYASLKVIQLRLADSPDIEHRHMAARLESDALQRVELISNALESDSSDFLVWDAVKMCAAAKGKADCPLEVWEKQMLAIDGQNSEAWIRAAANRYARGDVDGAYAAIQQAGAASESKMYWVESVEMFERGLVAGSGIAFPERAMMAFGIAARSLPDFGAFVTMCEEQSALSTDWAYACLAYGEVAELRGKTEIGQAIARAIQSIALEAIGDEQHLAEVNVRRDTARQNRYQSLPVKGSGGSLTVEQLLFANPTIFFDHLAEIRANGERSASAVLHQEALRWLEYNQDFACEQ